MNKIYTNDLNTISVPAEKVKSFETVKHFLNFYKLSMHFDYVSFDDSEYDIVIGCHLDLSPSNDPTFEFCFSCDETISLYFREAI